MTVKETLIQSKLIAISRGVRAEHIKKTAEILLSRGICCMEITFDHASCEGYQNTLACMDALSAVPGLLVGAGTVLTAEDVLAARDHGAKYIISPNTDKAVIEKTKELDLVSVPGAMTPTECVNAVTWGADLVKLFPAASLGIGYFKAIRGPLNFIPFVPTGGITPENIDSYLKAGAAAFGIGGNLINASKINADDFDSLIESADAFVKAIS